MPGSCRPRNVADVEVPDSSDVLAQSFDQVPFHDLHVIEVEQNFDEGAPHFADDVEGFGGPVQVVFVMVGDAGSAARRARAC